jgi:hypothetical protein
MNMRASFVLAGLALSASLAAGQASFGLLGYTENFNGMGTGTVRPTGYSHWFVTGSNDLYNASTPLTTIGTSLAGFTQRSVPLNVYTQSGTTNPPSNQSATSGTTYGHNAAFSSNTSNRILGAAGATNVGGTAIQLSLTNNTANPINTLDFSYDFVALSRGTPQGGTAGTFPIGTESEIPGFRVFFSLNGSAGPWTNIAALNYNVPANSPIGFTSTVSAAGVAIGNWAPGATLSLRWFKDNEDLSSPDPLYGIDNVSVIPAPGAAALMGLGLISAGRRRR